MQRWKILAAVALVGLGFASGASAKTEKAIVAGGCFWCVESDFEPVAGVIDVVSGYTGGDLANPTYENHEGHYEAVEITFDSSKISYDELIAKFLRSVDVTDAGGQFCDRGSAYRTAIFAGNAAQEASAKAAIAEAEAVLGAAVVTPVLAAGTFWIAEDYHQDYYKKNPLRYKYYRFRSGRDQFLAAHWDDPDERSWEEASPPAAAPACPGAPRRCSP